MAAEPTTQVYKKGEYLIHILLEQTRALKHPTSPDKTIDPLIQIEAFSQKKFSEQKKGAGATSTTLWNEHFYFTQKFQDGRQLQAEQIKFSVLDHRLFGSDAVVGQYELDFSTVYMNDAHLLNHKWIGLINPSKDFNTITGFLKVSVNIVAEGEPQTQLAIENEVTVKKLQQGPASTLFADGDLLLPPHIQTRGQQLKVTLIRGEKFMKMDGLLGTIDPYIVFEVGGIEMRTEQISKNQNPSWELNILIPVMQPCASEFLTMHLFDYDTGAKDEIVGSQSFKISDIARGALVQPFWVNIYGAHIDAEAEQRRYLCSHPDLGTVFAGRILLAIEIQDEDKPKLELQKITDKNVQQKFRQEQPLQTWDVVSDVYYVLNCPKQDSTYSVRLKWAEFDVATPNEKAKNGMCEFYKHIGLSAKFPYHVQTDLPDVFIYLMDGDKPICFKRFKAVDLMVPDGKLHTVTLIPDKSIRNTPLDQTGILRIRLCVSQQPITKMVQLQKPKNVQSGKLYTNLFQAHDLVSTDMDGLADPQVDVIFYDLKCQSTLINNTITPVWNQQLVLSTYNFEQDAIPPIILRFQDVDRVSRDFLGQVIIDFNEGLQQGYIQKNSAQLARPQWLDIGIYGQKVGRVLVSFNYNDNALTIPSQIQPKTTKHFIKMKLLGLRGLRSFGSMPVSKAFLTLNVQGIRQPGDKQLFESSVIQTQPKDSGSNPNIQSIIAFEIQLPEDEAYMPRLPGRVNDYVMKGLVQPLIGQFQVNLRKQKEKTLKTIKDKLNIAQRVLSQPDLLDSDFIHIHAEELPSPDADILKKTFILKGNTLNIDNVVKFVQYTKNNEEGIFQEIQEYPEEYIALGYDTQLQKSNLYMISQQAVSVQAPTDTQKNRLKKESEMQLKKGKLADIAIQLKNQNQNPKQEQQIDFVSNNKGDATISIQASSAKSHKHYRLCIPIPLEESLFMTKQTFDVLPIHMGMKTIREQDSMADIIFGHQDTEHQVGFVKGWMDVISETDLNTLKAHPRAAMIPNELNFSSGKTVTMAGDRELVTKSQVTVNIYIIDCFNLPAKDFGSMSDPYIRIKIGDTTVDNAKEHIDDECNPKFHKLFSIPTELPGASELSISVFDFDDFLDDELIGTTIIDLEERYFQQRWRSLKYVPVETRQLYHPSSSITQGIIRLFVEIIPSKQTTLLRNPWFIDQRPIAKFYIRVVVWDVYDVPSMDIEGTSDIYITGYVDENHKQITDTHYRSKNGRGSFNWRMVFPVELPQTETIISFQVFDKDIFSPDDFISDATYDITHLCSKAFENEINLKLLSDKEPETDGILKDTLYKVGSKGTVFEKYEIQTQNIKKQGYDAKDSGKIIISLEIVPEATHLKNPVGLGRSQPNHSPICPEPTGRIQFSWNPFTLMNELLGPKGKLLLLAALLMCLLTYTLVSYVPIISGNVIASAITG